jgi:hypothetical protein
MGVIDEYVMEATELHPDCYQTPRGARDGRNDAPSGKGRAGRKARHPARERKAGDPVRPAVPSGCAFSHRRSRLVMPAVRHVKAAGVSSLLDLREQQGRRSAGSRVKEAALFLIDACNALESLRDGGRLGDRVPKGRVAAAQAARNHRPGVYLITSSLSCPPVPPRSRGRVTGKATVAQQRIRTLGQWTLGCA